MAVHSYIDRQICAAVSSKGADLDQALPLRVAGPWLRMHTMTLTSPSKIKYIVPQGQKLEKHIKQTQNQYVIVF